MALKNTSEATDSIFAALYAHWVANSATVAGGVPRVMFQGVEAEGEDPTDDTTAPWVRISANFVDEQQTALSDCVASPGKKRYTCSGVVFVQVFVPRSVSGGYALSRALADVAKEAFRGKQSSGGVWYKNARVNTLPPEDAHFRHNAVIEFEFDIID